jgi:hypothetical protein
LDEAADKVATTVAKPHTYKLCLWGYVKDAVFVPLPTSLHQLHARFTDEIAHVDADMLRWIWD